MAQYEPSRILENPESGLESENMQQYVEIGNNTYLGTKDGIKYALIPSSDNKFKLCEIPSDSSPSLNSSKSSWYSSFGDERNDFNVTPTNGYKEIKLMAPPKEFTPPCKGQGDESGNSILSNPDSKSRYESDSIPREVSSSIEKGQINFDQGPSLTYTTLVAKQEKTQNECLMSYSIPQNSYFPAPQTQITPLTTKPGRFVRNRQRMQLTANTSTPYTSVSPVSIPSTRGHRPRRPRQVLYQYRAPLLHSTPNSGIQISNNSPMLMDSSKNSSMNSSSDAQVSFEYPRVPNNTPNSESEMVGKQKVLDLQQWVPQLHSRMEGFAQMDPRESHNEKERKRRLRIKNACQNMKNLLPCVCDKTDNATVFENAVHFIAYMRETIGTAYDMEFLEQTCVY